MSRAPRAGDRVVLERMPEWVWRLPEDSRRVFRFCLGRTYPVSEVLDDGRVVVDVSSDVDARFGGRMNDIRVEPEYLRVVPEGP